MEVRVARLKLLAAAADTTSMNSRPRLAAGPVVIALFAMVVALLMTACGGRSPVDERDQLVNVTERDFSISASQRLLKAGSIVLRATNDGPDAHELIVVRSRDGRLPLRSDGLTVNEEALERSTLGALEPGPPGSVRELSVHLSPGKYVLFCNMSGHYMGGMSTVLTVR